MNKKARNLIITVGVLMVVLVIYMLVTAQDQMKLTMDKDQAKYLFLEVQTIKKGTVINGESKSGKYFIDSPMYMLSGSNLRSTMSPELNSSVKAIFGSWFELSGDVGSGISSDIYPIRDLPYTQGNISILDIRGDNVTLSYCNSYITLIPGDSWKNETHQMEKTDSGLMNVVTTTVIYNDGKVTVSGTI